MPNHPKVSVVLGAQQARDRFRCEVSRELGIQISNDEHKPLKRLQTTILQGQLSKQMIELAEQQTRSK